jgi:hypothetical protein
MWFSPPGASAAFTDHFDVLLDELESRSAALSGSTDPVERRQKKAADKSIAAINKDADSLSDDLKTARKVAKTLIKAFPNEFSMALGPQGALGGNLDLLLGQALDGLGSDVEAALDALDAGIDGLPAGRDRERAQAAADLAADFLDEAGAAPDFPTAAKLLGAALKAVEKGNKIVAKAGDGGDCTGNSTVTMMVDGQPFTASTAGGEFTPSTGEFAVFGQTGGATFDAVTIILSSGVTGPGTYALNANSNFTRGAASTSPPTEVFTVTEGELVITSLNTANGTAQGTFTFTAMGTFGTTATIIVTQGRYRICGLTVNQ